MFYLGLGTKLLSSSGHQLEWCAFLFIEGTFQKLSWGDIMLLSTTSVKQIFDLTKTDHLVANCLTNSQKAYYGCIHF